MNKAVVLEIKEEYAAVLTDEGLVQKIRNENYEVGQEIDLTMPVLTTDGKKVESVSGKTFRRWYRGAAAAAAVFILSGGGLYYASQNVFAYSTVTVTTEEGSMELTLNKKDEVVAVRALDEKSEETAAEMEISVRKRSSLSETLDKITEGQTQAEITVSSRNDKRKEKLQSEVQEMIPPVPQQKPAAEIRPADTSAPAGQENTGSPAAPAGQENMNTPAAPAGQENTGSPAAPAGPENTGAPAAPAGPENTDAAAAPAGPESTDTQAAPAGQENMDVPPAESGMPETGEIPPDPGMGPAGGTPPGAPQGGGAFPPS